jgi:poly(3-hydroxybutyrate) depolymerase
MTLYPAIGGQWWQNSKNTIVELRMITGWDHLNDELVQKNLR